MTTLPQCLPQVRDRSAGPPTDRPRVEYRPLRPGEAAAVQEIFAGMSERSRLFRFLSPVPRLTSAMLQGLSDVDDADHVAWIAQVDGRPVALGSYAVLAGDRSAADLALAVVDRHQHTGIGRRLLAVLTEVACRRGLRTFTFTVDPENHAVRELLRTVSATTRYRDGLVEGQLAVS
jgi:ribosomal protein S18 acetylase RimI-like enzyme